MENVDFFSLKKSALWGSGLIFFKYDKEIAYSDLWQFNWNCRQIVRNGMKGKVTTLYGSSWVLSKF